MKAIFYIIIFCVLIMSALVITTPTTKEIYIKPTLEKQDFIFTPQSIPIDLATTTIKTIPPQVSATPAQIVIKKDNPVMHLTTPSVAIPSLPAPQKKPIAQDIIYKKGLESIVNFLCDQDDGKTTVATGVIITNNGYIVTNAHVTDDLKNNKPTCSVRRGSPARDFDTAQLIWIPAIYHATTSESVRATHDIAIWKLKQTTQTPFFDFDYETAVKQNETLLTLSYPAELLGAQIVFQALNLVFSTTIITEVNNSTIQSRATISAQHGSSGGVLIDPYTAKIHGIIFGINKTETISDRLLFSISPEAINKAVLEDTKKTLMNFLAGNP